MYIYISTTEYLILSIYIYIYISVYIKQQPPCSVDTYTSYIIYCIRLNTNCNKMLRIHGFSSLRFSRFFIKSYTHWLVPWPAPQCRIRTGSIYPGHVRRKVVLGWCIALRCEDTGTKKGLDYGQWFLEPGRPASALKKDQRQTADIADVAKRKIDIQGRGMQG